MTLLRNFINYKCLLTLVCISFISTSYADHLKGGWIKYSYIGKANGLINYSVSFYQYSDCSEPEKVDPEIYMAIYDAGTMNEFLEKPIGLSNQHNEVKDNFGPCFQNPPTICYIIAEYTAVISVPENAGGYILTVQRCCRIAGITNVPTSNSY